MVWRREKLVMVKGGKNPDSRSGRAGDIKNVYNKTRLRAYDGDSFFEGSGRQRNVFQTRRILLVYF